MTDRAARRERWTRRLTIRMDDDGSRLIVFEDIALGRLRRDPESGRWACEWRAGYAPTATRLAGEQSAEVAELWAVEEVAALLAIEGETVDRLTQP
jgi:hypothetical protein